MNRRLLGTVGVLVAATFGVGSCKSDPLSDLDNAPTTLTLNFQHVSIGVGQSTAVTASILDGRATPMEIPVEFAACNAAITAVPDTSYHPVPATSSRAVITAQTPAPSCVVATGGGFTDTVTVDAVPTSFTGALSSTTPAGGDTLTISSTAQLKFDTAAVTVTFGGGLLGTMLSKTTDQLVVLVPFSTAAPLTITGVLVTSYTPPLAMTLQTSAPVAQTGNQWAGSISWQTAPNLTAMIPTDSGGTARMIVATAGSNAAVCPEAVLPFGSTGPCMMFRFDVADTMTVRFRTDWDGTTTTDIDVYVCADSVVSAASFNANCFEDGGGGATGAKPQTTSSAQFTAGPHWFVIELYGGPTPANNYVTILRQP